MRTQYYQQSPSLDAIPDAELATRILALRCQISAIPTHDPTLPRDPRRSSLHGKGHGQPAQHVPYEQRYCRLCTPEPNTWGPYTLPEVGVPIGNEEHLIFHCPMLRDTQHNLEQDMHELLYTSRHKYKKHNMPTDRAAVPQDNQLQLILGSDAPRTMGPLSSQIKNLDTFHPQRHRFMHNRHPGPQHKATQSHKGDIR
jgi:hypothetical protein